jgi:hypothetical protein
MGTDKIKPPSQAFSTGGTLINIIKPTQTGSNRDKIHFLCYKKIIEQQKASPI